ncbi:hypothetical protein [Bradyrhizobium sp. 5.13L]
MNAMHSRLMSNVRGVGGIRNSIVPPASQIMHNWSKPMVAAQASKAQAISPLALRERTGSLSTAEIISVVQRVVKSLRTRPRFQYQELRRSMRCFVIPISRSPKMAFLDNMAAHISPKEGTGIYYADAKNASPFVDALFGNMVDPVCGLTDAWKPSSFTMFVAFGWPSAHSG